MIDVWDVELDNALYYLEPVIPQVLEYWYYDDFDNYREPLVLLHSEHRSEPNEGSDTLRKADPACEFPQY